MVRRRDLRARATVLLTGTALVLLAGCAASTSDEGQRLREVVHDLPGVASAQTRSQDASFDRQPSVETMVTTTHDVTSEQLLAMVRTWHEAIDSAMRPAATLKVTVAREDCHLAVDGDSDRTTLADTASFIWAACKAVPGGVVDLESRRYGRQLFVNTRTTTDPNDDPLFVDGLRSLPGARVTGDDWRLRGLDGPEQTYHW